MTTILRAAPIAGILAFGIILAACSSSGSDQDATSDSASTTGSSSDQPEAAPTTIAPEPAASDGGDEAGEADDAAGSDSDAELFPDIVGATATQSADGTWTVSATVSSPYDTPDRYADNWRVIGPDGTIYGERFLTHDHAGEQPFTRTQSGIAIPDEVAEVTIEGRDQVSGWGGGTFVLELAR